MLCISDSMFSHKSVAAHYYRNFIWCFNPHLSAEELEDEVSLCCAHLKNQILPYL